MFKDLVVDKYVIVFDVGFLKIKMEIYKLKMVFFFLDVIDVEVFDFFFSRVEFGIVSLVENLDGVELYLVLLLIVVKNVIFWGV